MNKNTEKQRDDFIEVFELEVLNAMDAVALRELGTEKGWVDGELSYFLKQIREQGGRVFDRLS